MVGSGHPFYLKLKASSYGTNDTYTSGLTRVGSSSSASDGDKLVLKVPNNAPDNLWYQCSAHPAMIGKLEIKNAYEEVKGTTIIMKEDSNGDGTYDSQVYKDSYQTNSGGVVDFTGVAGKAYEMSFTVSDSIKDSAVNATDVSIILDMSLNPSGTFTAQKKVAGDTNGDGKINGTDVSNVLDISLNSNNSDGNGVLRDSTKADPFVDNTITISPGNDMAFHAYIIGDANGSYADVLSAG